MRLNASLPRIPTPASPADHATSTYLYVPRQPQAQARLTLRLPHAKLILIIISPSNSRNSRNIDFPKYLEASMCRIKC